jgi:hypothetical protein
MAVQRALGGGWRNSHSTVHVPSSVTSARGEISQRGERPVPAGEGCCSTSTTIHASSGSFSTTPLNTYTLPGGGGAGRSVQDRIAMMGRGGDVVDVVEAGSTEDTADCGDESCRTPTRATTTLATAATRAANNVCQRSSGHPRAAGFLGPDRFPIRSQDMSRLSRCGPSSANSQAQRALHRTAGPLCNSRQRIKGNDAPAGCTPSPNGDCQSLRAVHWHLWPSAILILNRVSWDGQFRGDWAAAHL